MWGHSAVHARVAATAAQEPSQAPSHLLACCSELALTRAMTVAMVMPRARSVTAQSVGQGRGEVVQKP